MKVKISDETKIEFLEVFNEYMDGCTKILNSFMKKVKNMQKNVSHSLEEQALAEDKKALKDLEDELNNCDT